MTVVAIYRDRAHFYQARCCAMNLQMRSVDHDPLRLSHLADQFGEYPVETPS